MVKRNVCGAKKKGKRAIQRLCCVQDASFSATNKATLETAANFLSELSSAGSLPEDLRYDASYTFALVAADTCAAASLVKALSTLDGLKAAEASEQLDVQKNKLNTE